MNFGEALSKALKKANISQSELAQRLHVNKSSVNQYVKGTKYPSVEMLTKICNELNVSADTLLGLENTEGCEIDTIYAALTSRNKKILVQIGIILSDHQEKR